MSVLSRSLLGGREHQITHANVDIELSGVGRVGRYVDRYIGRASVDISTDMSVEMSTDISVEGFVNYT